MLRKLRRATAGSDSLTVVVPKYIVEELKLFPDKEIDISVKGTKIIIDTKVEG